MISIDFGPRSYTIAFAGRDAAYFGEYARSVLRGRYAVVVTDQNADAHAAAVQYSLEAADFATHRIVLPPGESQKTPLRVAQLYDAFAAQKVERSTAIVPVGGGVVGDLAGFAAATYNRGLQMLMVPTTLLAMVDSSVGGKVGVNLEAGKNLVGAFHQPAGVWIDPRFLSTLPEREYRSGLSEVVKYGAILDADFFAWLEREQKAVLAREPDCVAYVVERCCRIKAAVVQQDEREETGQRAILNFGHTFGHAFESAGGYGTWLHGEAVAAGMVCACRLAERLGRIDSPFAERVTGLLRAFGQPTAPLPEWPIAQLLEAMRRDKKTVAGQLRFVLPDSLGHGELVDGVPEALVESVLQGAMHG